MSGKHITWFNPFAQRQLSHIMLEGYMFFLIAKGGCERRDLLWQATSSMTLREIFPVSCDMEKFLLKDSFVS
jgi:hypothetical protein